MKHNRVKELAKGNLKHLLHGLAALYVLNLYYKDEQIKNLTDKDKHSVNRNFGSALFAVNKHITAGLKSDGQYEKNANFDECVFIEDYEPNSKKVACEVMAEMNNYVQQHSLAELEKLMKEKASKGEVPSQEWINQVRPQIMKSVFPIKDYQLSKKFNSGLNGLLYDIVLNKNQY